MKEKVVIPTSTHQEFRRKLLALLDDHAGKLDALEMLAISAHVVGQLVAMQDQREVTPQIAMACISRNIEQGNREAVNDIGAVQGNA